MHIERLQTQKYEGLGRVELELKIDIIVRNIVCQYQITEWLS